MSGRESPSGNIEHPAPSFGTWLRQRRRAHGLTQQELAERVACAPITVKKIEADERRPSRQVAERLVAALGVPEAEQSAVVRLARSLPADAPRLAEIRPAPSTSLLLSGELVRGYLFEQLIASGGFGAVYRARQPAVGREVAIKVILPTYADQPDFIRRFEVEAQLVARLEHPHIVPLYDYWREPGRAYLVMRYLRGGSLRELIQAGPVSLGRALALLKQIGAALGVAHRAGVIHRDLKPANLLLDELGNAYLADFGIAKELDSAAVSDPAGSIIGSPAYLAPEQIRGEQLSPRTDIYALGLVLYELLAGERPFAQATAAELIRRQLSERLPPLHERRPELPAALGPLIQRATAKEPGERYASVAELVDELQQACEPRLPDLGSAAAERAAAPRAAAPTSWLDAPPPYNPYKGLRAFSEADSEDFFGRAGLTYELLRRMAEPGPYGRLLAVVGPSGSGKSSLVRAGLLPALRSGGLPGSERWFIVDMIPGPHPLDQLALALGRVAVEHTGDLAALLRTGHGGLLAAATAILPDDSDTELLLLIDQFEEIFTLTERAEERELFLEQIYSTVVAPGSRVRLVVTLRADFYDRPLLRAGLGELVRSRTVALAALGANELQQAIVGPARRAGLSVEPALAAAISADLLAQPGGLPLLQYALSELYERRRGQALTLQDYQAIGGVAGALSRRAEDLYLALDQQKRHGAQQLFLRLVTPGEGADDTRRRARVAEWAGADDAPTALIASFVAARLLTLDRDPATREPTVELAHEALIGGWPRLRGWVDGAHDRLRLLRRLSQAAAEWAASKRDLSFVARGAQLAQLEGLSAEHTATPDQPGELLIRLTPLEAAYLAASLAERKREEQAQAAQQVAQAEARSVARSAALLRRLALALTVAIVLASGLAGLTWSQRDAALREGQARATAAAEAASERDSALSARATAEAAEGEVRALAQAGEALANLERKPERALLLALAALPTAPPYQPLVAQALYTSFSAALARRPLLGHQGAVRVADFAPDSRSVATGGEDGTLRIWAVADGRELLRLGATSAPLRALAFAPAGDRLVSGANNGAACVWATDSGRELLRLVGHNQAVSAASFSPDGQRILTASYDGTARIWAADSGRELLLLDGEGSPLRTAAWSPDGRTIATGGDDAIIRLWDAATGRELRRLVGHLGLVASVAWSPDSSQLLSGGADGRMRRWEASSGAELRQYQGNVGYLWSVAWSPDGQQALAGGFDGAAYLWDTQQSAPLRALRGHTAKIWAVAWSADGRTMLSTSDDGSARLWDVTSGQTHYGPPPAEPQIRALAWRADGSKMLVGRSDGSLQIQDLVEGGTAHDLPASNAKIERLAWHPNGRQAMVSSADGTLSLIDTADGVPQIVLRGLPAPVVDESWSPAGRLLAAHSDGSVRVWDLERGQQLWSLDPTSAAATKVAWAADGVQIAIGYSDGLVILVEATSRRELLRLTSHTARVRALAWSPDSARLASGSDDGTVRVWDAATGAELQTLRGHTGGVLALAWSADGALLLSGGDEGAARIWDATTGAELRLLASEDGIASVTAWLAGGEAVLVGTPQGSTRIWLLSDAQIIADVARRVCAFYDDAAIGAEVRGWQGCAAELAARAADLAAYDRAYGP